MSRWTSNDGSYSGKAPKGKLYRVRKVYRRGEGAWVRLELSNGAGELEPVQCSTQA
jgi:hypothetical protein